MIRILFTSLATAVLLVGTAAAPAFSQTLKSDQQPAACDCSNCSAEHCRPTSTPKGFLRSTD